MVLSTMNKIMNYMNNMQSSGLADTEKLSDLPSNTSLPTTKSSERVNSSQVLYHEKSGIGARRGLRSTMARNYFDTVKKN